MGDLRSSSIQALERAFTIVGLNFEVEHLTFKSGTECVKGYVANVACFESKAVHLEAVSSLTSDASVAALRGFIAIRSISTQIV